MWSYVDLCALTPLLHLGIVIRMVYDALHIILSQFMLN